MDREYIGIAAALISSAAWAIGAILYKKLGEKISSFGMNLAKGVINLVLMGIPLAFSDITAIKPDTFILLGISGLLGISLGDTFFFEALQKVGPHVMVLLALLGQVLTVLFAIFFLDERLTLNMWIGIIMVVSGIAIVLYSRISDNTRQHSASGIIYGLLSVLCMSVSVIIAKKGLSSVSAIQGTFIRMLWGTAGLLLWGGVTRRLSISMAPFSEVKVMKKFLLLVCLVSFSGFWLFHVAIKYTEVSIANTLSSTEPLFVIPLAAYFLKEKISLASIAGTVVSVIGIVLLCLAR